MYCMCTTSGSISYSNNCITVSCLGNVIAAVQCGVLCMTLLVMLQIRMKVIIHYVIGTATIESYVQVF